jgi:hypothetical protein
MFLNSLIAINNYMSENFTSFTFGSSGLRVIKPGRIDPPVDPEWYLPSMPTDSDAGALEMLNRSMDDLRLLTASLSSFLPENMISGRYLRVNSTGDSFIMDPVDFSDFATDFTSLSDTPEQMIPGHYLRVAADGSIEQTPVAPPDNTGSGSASVVLSASDYHGLIPDVIFGIQVDTGLVAKFEFSYIDPEFDQIVWKHWTDTVEDKSFHLRCNNDETGTMLEFQGRAYGQWSLPTGVTTLKQLVENHPERVIFQGQKSGAGGAGSLGFVKNLTSNTTRAGFYADLPDAIMCEIQAGNDNWVGRFVLNSIQPETGDGTSSELIYRADFHGTQDYSIHFYLDTDGSNLSQQNDATHVNANTQNLRWFIENGRALYYGSQ